MNGGMERAPITYFDRYQKAYRQERIYGEPFLRLLYGNAAGRALVRLLVSRPLFSRWYGWLMRRPASARHIRPFIEKYGLNAAEFAQPVEAFASFNAFFCRELRPEARPVDPDPAAVVFPADGRHLGWQTLGGEQRVFVKGQRWDLAALLGGDAALAARYAGGTLLLSRLCPVDYHHFHFPVAGRVLETRWAGRRLYSVNPLALRQRLAYLWQNRRCLTRLASERCGEVCLIEIGATHVGSLRHRPLPPDGQVAKGAPKGWFELGGSAVITLFEPGRVHLSRDLLTLTAEGTELYAHMGDRAGRVALS